MSKHSKKQKSMAEIGKEVSELWAELEEDMGEMAALHVACEQMGIDVDYAYECMAEVAE